MVRKSMAVITAAMLLVMIAVYIGADVDWNKTIQEAEIDAAYDEMFIDLNEAVYIEDAGAIAGYRNAAVNGYRTYRDHEISFFCIQEISFTDDYVDKEGDIYSEFYNFYYGV